MGSEKHAGVLVVTTVSTGMTRARQLDMILVPPAGPLETNREKCLFMLLVAYRNVTWFDSLSEAKGISKGSTLHGNSTAPGPHSIRSAIKNYVLPGLQSNPDFRVAGIPLCGKLRYLKHTHITHFSAHDS